MIKINSVVVFCGSKNGNDVLFQTDAKIIATIIAKAGLVLIYGGGSTGLMGIVADAALSFGGKVIGIIPEILEKKEKSHIGISKLIVTKDMHERKKLLFHYGDVAVVLPGGYGTLDELFEMVTWNNLSIHDKRIFILNTNGFYNHLITHIESMHKAGFLYSNPFDSIIILQNPEDILDYI